ncbi:MAG: hypothetical protein LBS44_01635 [Deltaproteobacteria bacterium]|jgi:hypothetical protein|nr:hypothetical protein [Deltaproteobacteria bacterium]
MRHTNKNPSEGNPAGNRTFQIKVIMAEAQRDSNACDQLQTLDNLEEVVEQTEDQFEGLIEEAPAPKKPIRNKPSFQKKSMVVEEEAVLIDDMIRKISELFRSKLASLDEDVDLEDLEVEDLDEEDNTDENDQVEEDNTDENDQVAQNNLDQSATLDEEEVGRETGSG